MPLQEVWCTIASSTWWSSNSFAYVARIWSSCTPCRVVILFPKSIGQTIIEAYRFSVWKCMDSWLKQLKHKWVRFRFHVPTFIVYASFLLLMMLLLCCCRLLHLLWCSFGRCCQDALALSALARQARPLLPISTNQKRKVTGQSTGTPIHIPCCSENEETTRDNKERLNHSKVLATKKHPALAGLLGMIQGFHYSRIQINQE